jgi:hypothetical protein
VLASTSSEAGAPAAVQAAARTSYTVNLLEGTISLNLSDGSTIAGTYHGSASVPSVGPSRATLEGEIVNGTGMFAGATGTIRGTGTGGFVNDGQFSVMLHAKVSTPNREPFDLSVTLSGISKSTCTTTAPPRMALDATGDAKGISRATAHLEHNLGANICAIIVE